MELVTDKGLDFLETIKSTKGTNAKKEILKINLLDIGNKIAESILYYTFNPYIAFNVVKVPKTKDRYPIDPEEAWLLFFSNADKCAKRECTGNAAINLMQNTFNKCSVSQEKWMRKILKKNLAIGVSTKTINKVSPGFIPTFEVSLAQKFDFKRLKSDTIAIEPKLDGIRCFAVVENNNCIIYARSGKQITNFDSTIGNELIQLGDGCYDGEIMGEDFRDLMRQVYRKEDINISSTYLSLFDYLPLNEWKNKKSTMSTFQRYDILFCKLTGTASVSTGMGEIPVINYKHLKLTKRSYIKRNMNTIQRIHDDYVLQGYEGAMIKDIDATYKFGRGWEVMKYKAFHDVDLPIKQLLEGTGKYSGKLGSVVVCFKGVDVQVGSGFSDELREKIWINKSVFVDRIIEVRYQEITPDGSLRFPTFVCFRNDR
jgi:DNA ligase 1